MKVRVAIARLKTALADRWSNFMAVWLIRAGSHGEYEEKFISENRVYVTRHRLDVNVAKLDDRAALVAAMTQLSPVMYELKHAA